MAWPANDVALKRAEDLEGHGRESKTVWALKLAPSQMFRLEI